MKNDVNFVVELNRYARGKKAASEGKSSERGEEATVTVVETKQAFFVLSSRDTERLPTGMETFIPECLVLAGGISSHPSIACCTLTRNATTIPTCC